jgi:hypothetical protein
VHHAILGYQQYAPAVNPDWTAEPRIWRAFPIVDPAKWPGIDLLAMFNDTFFMALMFFIGGLFVWRSLQQRRPAGYLRERMLRLGVPFVVAATVLAPLAYYPSFLQSGGAPGFAAYAQAWLSLGVWPAGPAWFLWTLLVLSAITALLYAVAQRPLAAWVRRMGAIGATPGCLFLAFAGIALLAYLPLAHVVSPLQWSELGPFTVQTSRIGLYAAYFAIGVAVGGCGNALWARDGAHARRWWVWQAVAPIVFFVFFGVLIAVFMSLEKKVMPGLALLTTCNALFALTGVVTSLTMIATFARFGHRQHAIWASLDRNAYGIFLVHYVFVAWLQYTLLDVAWPGYAKALTVIVGALALSWATTAALRRLRPIARII